MIKVLELFAGIGACSKALERLGIEHEIVDAVEIDKYAIASFNAIHGTNFEPQNITKWDKDIQVDLIMHGSPCFIAGTRILTDSGYKNIENIKIGDKVLTHTNSFNEVIDFGSDGEKSIYKVETGGTLPIYCTDNHPFYVRHKNRVWNNNLRRYEYSFSDPEKVRLYNLTKNDNYIGVPIIPDKSTEFDTISEETLWLLGRYVADGYYCDKPREDRPSNQKYTCISVGNRKSEDFENHIKTYQYSIDNSYKGCKKYRFGVGLTNIIMDYGFNKGALNKNIPLGILQLPKHKLKVFLDGYMSGDGCNIKHSSIYQATTISRELAESLVLAVQKVYGIGCRIYHTKRPKTTIIEDREVNQSDTYMIRFDINPKNPRYLVDDGCVWYPIKKILNTNTMQVIYNLTVDEDHTYTANNCYVGNCQDFSIAGKQAGGDVGTETRSSLMWETVRIVEKLKPKYVIWENVKNVLSKKHKHNFDAYINKMKELGYTSYYQVLNAKDYGIPQNRERVFTISIRKDTDRCAFKFPEKEDLKLRLKDMLEEQVDEKYYLSDKMMNYVLKPGTKGYMKEPELNNEIAKPLLATMTKMHRAGIDNYIAENPKCEQVGTLDIIKRVYSDNGLSPTLTNMQGGNRQPKILEEPQLITHNIQQTVKVRKYPVDTDNLKIVLRIAKLCGDLNNREIANKLNIPQTQVEHYFRTDNSFAIPSPEIWFKLKEVLGITTNKFDESIMTFEEKEGVYEKANRVYDEQGLAPTLTQQEEKILVKNATKKGYDEAIEGDSINLQYPDSNTRRGRVGHQVSQTIQCNDSLGVVERINKNAKHQQDLIQDQNNICRCIPAGTHGSTPHLLKTIVDNKPLKIRKLTPKECWRLMGFDDEDFEKAEKVNSNTQLYKQARKLDCRQCIRKNIRKLIKYGGVIWNL